jgi:hypothetical protein
MHDPSARHRTLDGTKPVGKSEVVQLWPASVVMTAELGPSPKAPDEPTATQDAAVIHETSENWKGDESWSDSGSTTQVWPPSSVVTSLSLPPVAWPPMKHVAASTQSSPTQVNDRRSHERDDQRERHKAGDRPAPLPAVVECRAALLGEAEHHLELSVFVFRRSGFRRVEQGAPPSSCDQRSPAGRTCHGEGVSSRSRG